MSFLPIVIVITGAYMLIRLRAFFLLHPLKTMGALCDALSSSTSRKNLALSLAGTLGVGNIVGVAVGISVGGAGAVFWLLLSSVFSVIIKYSESSLSADLSGEWGIAGAFSMLGARYGKYLSYIYAVCCLILSLFLGSSIQASAIVSCVSEYGGDGLSAVFIVSLALVFVLIIGREKIKGITALLVPVASVTYIILCVCSIMEGWDRLPSVIALIFEEAFSGSAAVGGIFGFLTGGAIKEGFSRGLMSNEAGAGTSSLANSEGIASPHHAGLLGVVEVFFDTVVICTLSSLAILTDFNGKVSGENGMKIVLSALGDSFFGTGGYVLLICVSLFAISSIICWYYYGVKCAMYLGIKRLWLYSALFIASLYLSLVISEGVLVWISDFFLFILTFLTSFILIKSSDRIRRLSELGGLIKNSRR